MFALLDWHDWTLLYYLSEWLVRVAMLFYVPQRRSPAAARTWLLLIFLAPWAGLVLYAFFGRAYLPGRRLQLRQETSQRVRSAARDIVEPHGTHPDLAPALMEVVKLAENLGDFPITRNNTIELLTDYDGSIDRLIGDVREARNHVHLLYYIFADDATGGRVADALIEATGRGVTCRLLIDSLGSKKARRSLVPRLRAAGVEVTILLPHRWFRLRGARLDLRNHRKIAVMDGRVGYVGSQNVVDATFKKGIVYQELVARVTGPVVLELQGVFLIDRYFETEKALQEERNFPAPEWPGTSPAQVLPSGPSYPHANNQRLIVALVHAARQRVVITTPYFIPDEALSQALQTAALRGVEVHLVVSKKADQLLVGLAQPSYYEELLEAGVHIHRYREGFLHAKHLSIDDTIVLIGSSNMDLRSFQLNAEVTMLVYDPEVARRLRAVQERTLTGADELTLAEWQKRSLLTRTLQNIARLLDSLL